MCNKNYVRLILTINDYFLEIPLFCIIKHTIYILFVPIYQQLLLTYYVHHTLSNISIFYYNSLYRGRDPEVVMKELTEEFKLLQKSTSDAHIYQNCHNLNARQRWRMPLIMTKLANNKRLNKEDKLIWEIIANNLNITIEDVSKNEDFRPKHREHSSAYLEKRQRAKSKTRRFTPKQSHSPHERSPRKNDSISPRSPLAYTNTSTTGSGSGTTTAVAGVGVATAGIGGGVRLSRQNSSIVSKLSRQNSSTLSIYNEQTVETLVHSLERTASILEQPSIDTQKQYYRLEGASLEGTDQDLSVVDQHGQHEHAYTRHVHTRPRTATGKQSPLSLSRSPSGIRTPPHASSSGAGSKDSHLIMHHRKNSRPQSVVHQQDHHQQATDRDQLPSSPTNTNNTTIKNTEIHTTDIPTTTTTTTHRKSSRRPMTACEVANKELYLSRMMKNVNTMTNSIKTRIRNSFTTGSNSSSKSNNKVYIDEIKHIQDTFNTPDEGVATTPIGSPNTKNKERKNTSTVATTTTTSTTAATTATTSSSTNVATMSDSQKSGGLFSSSIRSFVRKVTFKP